jgi:hypothetical protein
MNEINLLTTEIEDISSEHNKPIIDFSKASSACTILITFLEQQTEDNFARIE